jgi:hypothetical protein
VSVKNLLRKFTGWFRGKRSGPLSFYREPQAECTRAIPTPLAAESKVRVIIWTLDEAETAWRAGRTKYDLAETFRRFAMSLESMAGNCLVDGKAARVVVCVNEAVKQRVLSAPLDEMPGISKAERAREEDWLERQTWAKSPPDLEPIEGRTCGACGGKLLLVILNYYCDPGDIITPADTAEKCLSCGASTVLIHRRGRAEPQRPETNNDDRRQ